MLTKFITSLAVFSVILISGCADSQFSATHPTQGSPTENPAAGPASKPSEPPEIASQTATEPRGQITLREAVAYALVNSPQLRAFSWDIHTAEANQMQAALLPNPELEVAVEEFGGTGERRAFNSSESTIQIGQFIELAQKRSKRIHLASLEKQLAQWDYYAKRLDVMNQVAAAFVDVLAAQERLTLSKELLRLAEQTHAAVAQRVSGGKDSPLEETKAKVALSTMQIQSQAAAQALKSARTRLAAAWGASAAEFHSAVGQLYQVSPVP